MLEKLYLRSHSRGTTNLSDWFRASRQDIGGWYTGELRRRLDRRSTEARSRADNCRVS
jgi:hypothetical protein